jgi:hypothetical protein
MADVDTVKAELAAGRWTEPSFERVDAEFIVGPTIDEAIAFALTLGPAGEVLRDAGPLADAKRPAIVAELAEALRPFASDRGVALRASSWCVTARA